MMFEYPTSGTCSKNIKFSIIDERLGSVEFDGGCKGNTKALATLLEGMPVKDVVEKLAGIPCGAKGTSCADQLAKAVTEAMKRS